jgi:hypothetical protein
LAKYSLFIAFIKKLNFAMGCIKKLKIIKRRKEKPPTSTITFMIP